MLIIWRIMLIGLALFLAWRIVATGLGGFYADRMNAGDDDAMEQVLAWQPEHPEALRALAERVLPDDAQAAQALLVRAYRANPANPRPLIILATQFATNGEIARADALMDIAARLAPVNPGVQKQLASYWARRNNMERSLKHLSTMMEASPSQRAAMRPVLLQIAEDPAMRGLLTPYALSPPAWWDGFFRYAAINATALEPVRLLYKMRRQSGAEALTGPERAAYVGRLQKDGLITEAYLTWLAGLDKSQRKQLGPLFNGGFELKLSNQRFGWQVGNNNRVDMRTRPRPGALGNGAMHLNFRAVENRFGHLVQPLVLDAGTYRLTGETRTGIDFVTKGGLKWQVDCRLPARRRLGESERIVGADEWTQFSFKFIVSPSCRYQELRLVSAGTRAFELKISGDIWFDNLSIARASSP